MKGKKYLRIGLKNAFWLIIIGLFLNLNPGLQAQIKFEYKQQLAGWASFAHSSKDNWKVGMLVIPGFEYSKPLKQKWLFDSEFSVKLNASRQYTRFTEKESGSIKPYRAWLRFSTNQLELRFGLQKINFGSANTIRPLMWFDQMDPRDPLQLTSGMWGALGRYYFMNNATVWLWALTNREAGSWYFSSYDAKLPELGGRIQYPLKKGEVGFSYNYENSKIDSVKHAQLIGFDIKLNFLVSLWLEGTHQLVHNQAGNQVFSIDLWNLGVDYTIPVGSGLLASYEFIYYRNTMQIEGLKNQTAFSLVTVSGSLTPFDRVFGMMYWAHSLDAVYPFVSWQHQFSDWSVGLMAYWNPNTAIIPGTNYDYNTFTGKGLQLMLSYDFSVEKQLKLNKDVN